MRPISLVSKFAASLPDMVEARRRLRDFVETFAKSAPKAVAWKLVLKTQWR